MLEEDLTQGHIVAAYTVEVDVVGAGWVEFSSGNPIGKKRIDLSRKYTITAVRLTILQAYDNEPEVVVSAYAPC